MKKLSFLICILFLVGCSQSKTSSTETDSIPDAPSQELTQVLWDYNAQIPDYPTPYSTARKAEFDYDNQMFQYNYEEIWEETTNKDTEQSKIDDIRLSTLKNQLKNDVSGETRRFLELLVRDGYGLSMQYVGKYKNKTATDTIRIEISVQEIKDILKNK